MKTEARIAFLCGIYPYTIKDALMSMLHMIMACVCEFIYAAHHRPSRSCEQRILLIALGLWAAKLDMAEIERNRRL